MPLHDLRVLLVVGCFEWVREVRALLVDHLDDHAHGLRNDEDVREDDSGVEKPSEALNGLQGQCRGDFRVAAAFEEIAAALGLVILGEVATGWCMGGQVISQRSRIVGSVSTGWCRGLCTLAHHPDGWPLDLLACVAMSALEDCV